MTDQITVPRATWDALREALKAVRPDYEYRGSDVLNQIDEALTAANAVSEPKSLFVDLIASHGPDFVDEMAAIDVEPEALITVESSLRFRLECEQQKSTDLLDEVRELKGKLLKARQPQAQGEARLTLQQALNESGLCDYYKEGDLAFSITAHKFAALVIANPQATEPAEKTRDPLDLVQYVNEANISANDKPVAVIEKLQAVINVKKGFQ